MADVKFTGKSDFEKVKKDYESLARHTSKVEAENQKLKRASDQVSGSFRKVNRAQSGGLAKGIAGLKGMIGQYVGLQAAISAVNKTLEANRRLADEAAGKSMTIAQAESAVIKNVGDVSDDTAKRFLSSVKSLSAKAGMPSAAPMLTAASSILSAVGGDRRKTLDILGTSAPFFRDKPGELAQFGGALGDVMKVTGGSAKSTAALMLAIQGQARFENLAAFKEVAPALASASVVTRGDRTRNTREAAALFAAIGSRAGDVEGSVTKTAVANLSANLARVVPELGTTFQRLEKVRANPAMQAEVLKSGFKGAIKPIIAELLSGGNTQTGQMVTSAFAKIQGSERAFTRKARQLTGLTPSLRLQSAAQRSEGATERFLTEGTLARRSAARKILTETLDKTRRGIIDTVANIPYFTNAFDTLVGRGSPEQRAMDILRQRRALIVRPYGGGFDTSLPTKQEMQSLSPAEREMIRLIRTQIGILGRMERNAEASRVSTSNSRAAQQERVSQAVE